MAEDEQEEEEGPAVELGEATPVEGVPLAQVASRLTWAMERSEVRRREGDTEIRTADGPRALADVLRENGWVLVGAGGWFLAVQALGWGLRVAPWIDWLRELMIVDLAAFVLNWTGVGAVVLYAVAVGSARVRADPATTD